MRPHLILASLAISFFLQPVGAEEHIHRDDDSSEPGHYEAEPDPPSSDLADTVDWRSGQGVGFGGFLFPELFALGTVGESTGDLDSLAVSDHDPVRSAVLQSLHAAAMLQVGDLLTGMANLEGVGRADGTVNAVLEEAFLHLHPTSWLAVGGGQFLNAFGFQNKRHVHAWDFVDQYLVYGRMMNEGELMTQGGEVILGLPTPWQSALTIGGGGARIHGHGHSGEEGDHHHGEEAEFDAKGAGFNDWLLTGNYTARYGAHDQMAGMVSFAVGENGFGEITQVYGIGHEIAWNPSASARAREAGSAAPVPTGREMGAGSLHWRSEALFRSIEARSAEGHGHEEEGHAEDSRSARLDEFGFYSMLKYGLTPRTSLALRAEWVSGIDEMDLEERWRLSPALTAYLNPARTVHTRLQYNFDHGRRAGDDHTIWLQVGIAWGGMPGAHGHEH